MTDIAKLRAKRESLKTQIAQIDARIAKIEREQREHEQREIVKLIQSRGITAAQLAALLPPATRAPETKNDTKTVPGA